MATAVGMSMLEKGGNAFDAAVATGFALQILEPHLNGPGGDLPAVLYTSEHDRVDVICAQGTAPAGATIEHYHSEGLDLIPDNGLLATVIPGAFDGWMLMLRNYGTLPLRTVLEPAIDYAVNGHPILPRVAATIGELSIMFANEWPTSAATWMPGGKVPEPYSNFKNPVLGQTWQRLLTEAESVSGREAQIDAARDVFYRGFIAATISDWLHDAEAMDASGNRHKAVLAGDDLANWHATIEQPLEYDYHGWTLSKTQAWGQGPVLLQSLALLRGTDIASADTNSAEFVHTIVEAMKLAYADREAYYGDPDFSTVPMKHLLSDVYNDARRQLIGDRANHDFRPGHIDGFEQQVDATHRVIASLGSTGAVYEPTMAHLSNTTSDTTHGGDTVHIDVIDKHGNMVSVTPSGGWLQSSPTIPGLGFCLNSRAQMFWLAPDLPTSLAPGRRPRTTLTPSIARHTEGARMAFGTPGGDQQDQWQLIFFLRYVHHQFNLQEVIDQPLFHTTHFPSSFYPRSRQPGHIMIEESIGDPTLKALQSLGHDVTAAEAWSIGRLTAAKREVNGLLRAAATPRLMQAYAIGR